MLKYILIAVLCLHLIFAEPESESGSEPQQRRRGRKKEPKDTVVREVNENDGSGNFYWLRETLDGGRSEQVGYRKDGNQVIEGSFTEVGEDGQLRTVNYVADRTGYHPVGDHLPKSPKGRRG